MRTSRYSEIARSAALHEKCGSLDQAAKLWRQANELAVLKSNVDWTAHRAHVCESRLRLAAKAARVRNGGAAFNQFNDSFRQHTESATLRIKQEIQHGLKQEIQHGSSCI